MTALLSLLILLTSSLALVAASEDFDSFYSEQEALDFNLIGLGPRGTRRRPKGTLDNHKYPQVTLRPVVGILTAPMEARFKNATGTSFLYESYVQWLEQGGVRVVPLLYNWRWSSTEFALDRLNGVLIQGGSTPLWRGKVLSAYAERACAIYHYIKSLNSEHDVYYPIWATDTGMHLLHLCASLREATVRDFAGEPAAAKRLVLTISANYSRLFANSREGKRVLGLLSEEPAAMLQYSQGISTRQYKNSRNLTDAFTILALVADNEGKTLVAISEGVIDPFYCLMFSPERSVYDWSSSSSILRSRAALQISSYFAIFFGNEARRCGNAFYSEERLHPWLIYNWKVRTVAHVRIYEFS